MTATPVRSEDCTGCWALSGAGRTGTASRNGSSPPIGSAVRTDRSRSGTSATSCRPKRPGSCVRKVGWGDPALLYDEQKDLFRFTESRFSYPRERADWGLLRK
jgi:hypothetical protein